MSVSDVSVSATLYPYSKKEIRWHRFMRTVIPGVAFGLSILVAILENQRFYPEYRGEGFWAMVAMFCVPFGLAAGIGLNTLGVGLAKRRDRSIWLRFIVPAVFTAPIWSVGLLVFNLVNRTDVRQIQLFDRMHPEVGYNTPYFIGIAIFVVTLYLPVILSKNLFVRFVVQFVGMLAAAVGLFYLSLLTTDGGQIMGYISTTGPAYHYIILFFAFIIPFGLWFAERSYPQLTGQHRDPSQQPLTGDALIREQNREANYGKGFKRVLGALAILGVIAGVGYLLVSLVSQTNIAQDVVSFVQNAVPFVFLFLLLVGVFSGIYAILKGIARLFSRMSPEERRAAGAAAVGFLAILGAVAAASAASKNQQAQEDAAKQAAARAAAAKRAQQQAALQRQQQQLAQMQRNNSYQPPNERLTPPSCSRCGGSGVLHNAPISGLTCPACGGSGHK